MICHKITRIWIKEVVAKSVLVIEEGKKNDSRENLFWHGIFNVETVNVTGANTRQMENSNWVYNEESIPILKVTVLNTINDISYCFKHCNCSP